MSKEEQLQEENNLLKAKLTAENGAVFPEKDRTQLDSKSENDWLNYIYDYEQVYKHAPTVTVYEKLGKPSFKPSDKLDNTAVSSELTSLLNCMAENGIDLI